MKDLLGEFIIYYYLNIASLISIKQIICFDNPSMSRLISAIDLESLSP